MIKLKNFRKFLSLIKLRITLKSKASKDVATFGVMPDYSYDGKGMRMDSVSSGKTAEKHGFQPGDIITKIDELGVTDLMSYMSVLSKYHVGDTAEVTFLREQTEMQITVQFM